MDLEALLESVDFDTLLHSDSHVWIVSNVFGSIGHYLKSRVISAVWQRFGYAVVYRLQKRYDLATSMVPSDAADWTG